MKKLKSLPGLKPFHLYSVTAQNDPPQWPKRVYVNSSLVVRLEDMNFPDGIYALKKHLGADVIYVRIRSYYFDRLRPLKFPRGEKWALNLDNDCIKSIWIEGRGEIGIEETPDMRWVLINQVKK